MIEKRLLQKAEELKQKIVNENFQTSITPIYLKNNKSTKLTIRDSEKNELKLLIAKIEDLIRGKVGSSEFKIYKDMIQCKSAQDLENWIIRLKSIKF